MTDTPTPPPMPPTSDVSRPNARRLGTIVVGIAVLSLVGFFYLDSRDAQDQLSSQVQQNADLQKQLENLAETVSEIKTSKLYRQEEQTIARDDSLSALQMGKLAEDRITELRQSAAGWQITRDKYLQNTEGRRIASDPQLTEQVQTLLKSDIPTPEHADRQVDCKEDLFVVGEVEGGVGEVSHRVRLKDRRQRDRAARRVELSVRRCVSHQWPVERRRDGLRPREPAGTH